VTVEDYDELPCVTGRPTRMPHRATTRNSLKHRRGLFALFTVIIHLRKMAL